MTPLSHAAGAAGTAAPDADPIPPTRSRPATTSAGAIDDGPADTAPWTQTWRPLGAAGATLAAGLRAPASPPAERAWSGAEGTSGAGAPPERTGATTPPEPTQALNVEPAAAPGLPGATAALRAALARAGAGGLQGVADISAAELRDTADLLLTPPEALPAMVAYLEAVGEACRPASIGAMAGAAEAEHTGGAVAADYLESATLFTVLAPSYVAGLARLMARAPRAPTSAWQEGLLSVRRQVSPSAWPEFCTLVERLLPPAATATQADLWRAVQALADVPAAARRRFVEVIAPTPAVWQHMGRLATTAPALLVAHRDALLVGVAPDRALYVARRALAEATPATPAHDTDVAASVSDVAPPSAHGAPRRDARTGLQYAALLAVAEQPWPVDGSAHPAHGLEARATLMSLSQDPVAWAALAPESRFELTMLGLCHLLLMPDVVVPPADAALDIAALPGHREAARAALALFDRGRSMASAEAARSAGRTAVAPRWSEVLAFIAEHELLWVRHLVARAVALNPAAEAADDANPGARRRTLLRACDEIALTQALISERLTVHRDPKAIAALLDARAQLEERFSRETETLRDARVQLQRRIDRF